MAVFPRSGFVGLADAVVGVCDIQFFSKFLHIGLCVFDGGVEERERIAIEGLGTAVVKGLPVEQLDELGEKSLLCRRLWSRGVTGGESVMG